jgi:hypothetical protein
MIEVYWICLLGGFVFAVLAVLFGDLLDAAHGALHGALEGAFQHLLDPLSLVGGVTVFGGAGVVLERYTDLGDVPTALLAGALGVVLAVAMHFAYVRPMRRGENSTAFSRKEYAGKIGEVNTAIPARGYGEVLVRMGASVTFQPAASFDGTPIRVGTAVVVVEVEADGALLVTPLEDEPAEPDPLPVAEAPRLPEPALA